jgi:hypothetical protein
MIGKTVPANRSASWIETARPLAAAMAPFVGLPSFVPQAFREARADLVRSEIMRRDAAAGACSNWSACRPASSSRQSLKQIPIWQAWLSRVLCTSCPHRSLASSEITTFIGALPSCSCTEVSFQRALVFSQKMAAVTDSRPSLIAFL